MTQHGTSQQQGHGRYAADIRWTTHGVAHIRADTWASLGFGQGWACARDHLPTIADQIVKVRSERARYHGPGPEGAHVASDLGYLVLGVVERAEAFRAAQPPEVRDLIEGYVAGVNAWREEAEATDALPPWCAGAEWIRPLSDLDLYAYLGDIALMASGRNLVGIIGRAEAPGDDGPAPPSPLSALGGDPVGASNGWALGRDVTASGHGLVMANPHFPWSGEARFWECHLTLPGELDVYGVALLGTPGVQMGFNRDVAWSHTFSHGHRFTLAQLRLVPGRPTSYVHGDVEREMTPTTYSVTAADGDGGQTTVERTLWITHHGPMVNLPVMGWGTEVAFAYRDTNLDNAAVITQFLAMDRATSTANIERSFAEIQGLPWVNTLAADRSGRAWYTDASATPALSPEAQERFRRRVATDPVASLLFEKRVALLDGSDPGDDWIELAGARSPGLIPHDQLPQLERTDYVVNANDSHWLAHPDAPLEGYSVLHGFERVGQSLRTRQNLRTVARLAADGDQTVTSVLEAVMSNDSLSAELLRDDVVARLVAAGSVEVDGTTVDLVRAAEVLEAWDGRFELASVGAALWRESVTGFPEADLRQAGGLFAIPFDPDDPVATPATLAPAPGDGPDPVIDAVARAVVALETAGVAIDAPLSEVQWAQRGEHRVPVHGGGDGDGVCNIFTPLGALVGTSLEPGPPPLEIQAGRSARTGLRFGGYRCTYGTSFLMAVEMTDDGPRGRGLLAYGQSGDPRSPHHLDGTRAYADKVTRPLLFDEADVLADPELVERTITGG